MHNYWYNSPLKFYRLENEHFDVLNPQNIQTFGDASPYILELGKIHRFLLPTNYPIDTIPTNNTYTLFIVKNGIQTPIDCILTEQGADYKYISFRSNAPLDGYLLLKSNGFNSMFSNCVSFQDTTDNSGLKQLRLVTKHNFNRQKFQYELPNAYFVTNIPSYERGLYNIDADITNDRYGDIAGLNIEETYLDEVVKYEFDINGNGDIVNFITSMFANKDVFINGTKRTLKDAIEVDEQNMFATAIFVNNKDKYGNNITINEDDVFSDIRTVVTSVFPLVGSSLTEDYIDSVDNAIYIEFSNQIKLTSDINKRIRVYRSGVEIINKSYTQVDIVGNRLVINNTTLNPSDIELTDGTYTVSVDSGFALPILTDNVLDIPNSWTFAIASSGSSAVIEWIEGGNIAKDGFDTSVDVKMVSRYDNPSNPIIIEFWVVNGTLMPYSEVINIPLAPNMNVIQWVAQLQNGDEAVSNELTYNRQVIELPILTQVVKSNNNTVVFTWDNQSISYVGGSTIFQISTNNGGTWENLLTIAGKSAGIHTQQVSSPLINAIPNNTNVSFRLICNAGTDRISNVRSMLWVIASISIRMTDIVNDFEAGKVTYKLHVEQAPFNGYACVRVENTENCKRAWGVSTPYGGQVDINSASETLKDKYEYISLPIGIYDCELITDSIANSIALPHESSATIGYSLSPSLIGSIRQISIYKRYERELLE